MLQIFLGVTNSNKFYFEIWSFINLHRNILSFSPFKVDQKFGKTLSIKSNFMLFMSRIWVDIRKIHNSKLTKFLTSLVIFQYHLVTWYKFKVHATGRFSDLSMAIYTQAIKKSTEGVKNDPHRFCHLK